MLELMPSTTGCPGLKCQGRVLHNPRYPLDQARTHVGNIPGPGSGLIIMIGLGLGYHLQAMGEKFPGIQVAVFEPEVEFRELFARTSAENQGVDLSGIELTLLTDWHELNDFLNRQIVHGQHPDPVIFIFPGLKKLFPGEVDDFIKIIRGAILRRAVNDKTLREKGILFLNNLAENLPAILAKPMITALKNRFKGLPGFIVGSGPSLEQTAGIIGNIKGRGLILAASTALKPLVAMGIEPEIVVVIEAEDTSEYLLDTGQNPDCVLAVASAAHPGHFNIPGFLTTFFHLNYGTALLFGDDDFAPQAGTAGSAAFTLGLLLGLNPLVLVGQDQCVGERLHARGTPGEVEKTPDMETYLVDCASGGQVRTHSGFAASLHWFAEAAGFLSRTEPERIVVNASDNGAHIPGIPDMPLKKILDRLGPGSPPPGLAPIIRALPPKDPARVKSSLKLTWELVGGLLMMMRLKSEAGAQALAEYRGTDPVLRLLLAGLDQDPEPGEAVQRLEEAENLILNMLSEFD